MLVEKFQESEIREVVRNCDSNKSPSPYNFKFKFFKKFWPTLKDDVLKVFADFYEHGVIPKAANPSFTTLVPKVDGP